MDYEGQYIFDFKVNDQEIVPTFSGGKIYVKGLKQGENTIKLSFKNSY